MKATLNKFLDRTPTVLFVLMAAVLAFALGRVGTPQGESVSHAGHTGHDYEEADGEYVCPMHPQIRQTGEGTCPICFMDLVPVETSATEELNRNEVALSPAASALAEIRTEAVRREPLSRSIEVFGRVATTDTGDANITAWTGGRIERLYVEDVGSVVHRGQRLARIYSPALVVAQETLIHAREILADAEAAASQSRVSAARATEHAALTELRLLGVGERQIEDLVADGVADESVQIYAPAGGTMVRRFVSRGDHVARGDALFELVDLDEVWIQLEIYERDLPSVSPGARVMLRVPGAQSEEFAGTIAFLDPVIDPERRVARARVVVDNAAGEFRPDLFVEGEIEAPVLSPDGRSPVTVPSSAVLWTGRRSLVYVQDVTTTPPVYVAVEVDLGESVADRQVILSGIFPGERVVSNGAFRLDASLQIRGGASMMSGRVQHGH